MKASDIIFNKQNTTERAEIEDSIEDKYIIDYGVIKAMRGTTACDVTHAIQRVMTDGTYYPPTVTENVEILWPSAGQISFKCDLVAGDKVLLVGMKHYLSSVGQDMPKEQQVFNAYNQETLRAIPLGLFNSSSKIQISVSGGNLSIAFSTGNMTIDLGPSGTLAIKNEVASLKTVLDSLISNLITGFATPAASGSPIWAGASASLSPVKSQLDQLLGS